MQEHNFNFLIISYNYNIEIQPRLKRQYFHTMLKDNVNCICFYHNKMYIDGCNRCKQ